MTHIARHAFEFAFARVVTLGTRTPVFCRLCRRPCPCFCRRFACLCRPFFVVPLLVVPLVAGALGSRPPAAAFQTAARVALPALFVASLPVAVRGRAVRARGAAAREDGERESADAHQHFLREARLALAAASLGVVLPLASLGRPRGVDEGSEPAVLVGLFAHDDVRIRALIRRRRAAFSASSPPSRQDAANARECFSAGSAVCAAKRIRRLRRAPSSFPHLHRGFSPSPVPARASDAFERRLAFGEEGEEPRVGHVLDGDEDGAEGVHPRVEARVHHRSQRDGELGRRGLGARRRRPRRERGDVLAETQVVREDEELAGVLRRLALAALVHAEQLLLRVLELEVRATRLGDHRAILRRALLIRASPVRREVGRVDVHVRHVVVALSLRASKSPIARASRPRRRRRRARRPPPPRASRAWTHHHFSRDEGCSGRRISSLFAPPPATSARF